jgi:hypothetical protein
MQQLILGTGTAIWWLTEPHLLKFTLKFLSCLFKIVESKAGTYLKPSSLKSLGVVFKFQCKRASLE